MPALAPPHILHVRAHPHTSSHRLMQTQQEQVLPFIYTPTVGEACQRYHQLPIRTDGLYITLEDRGRMAAKLQQWPQEDVQVIVVTGALFRLQGCC